MKPKQALRVRLTPENTAKVQQMAQDDFTTPPRVVNKILSRHKPAVTTGEAGK